MSPQALKPYLVHAGVPDEIAVLAFAHNVKEARNIAACSIICDDGAEFIDIRVNLIREPVEEIWQSADAGKLQAGIPHFINSPIGCQRCGTWGLSLTESLCKLCYEACR